MSSREDAHRLILIEELHQRYGDGGPAGARLLLRLRFWQKKYAWLAVVGGAQIVKRAIDIIVAGTALLCLSPLFFVVAVLIKLTDGGPVLFWQTRVGRWGSEFAFPKFRSMV